MKHLARKKGCAVNWPSTLLRSMEFLLNIVYDLLSECWLSVDSSLGGTTARVGTGLAKAWLRVESLVRFQATNSLRILSSFQDQLHFLSR